MIIAGIAMCAVYFDGRTSNVTVKSLKVAGAVLVSVGLLTVIEYRAQTGAAAGIAWSGSLEDALRNSQKSGKPVILDFSAEWCAACKEMDATTFSDPRVAAEINSKWIPARIDATRNSPELDKILEKYNVQGFPTVILISPSGEILDKITGYATAEELLAKISSPTKPLD
jgi:thiol:disulfide interchange protein DsbD